MHAERYLLLLKLKPPVKFALVLLLIVHALLNAPQVPHSYCFCVGITLSRDS